MITGELAAFLHQGLSLHIGVRDSDLQPDGSRAIAVQIDEDGRHLVVYVAQVAAARLLPHLADNGHVAVTFARPTDDRACQVKGTFVSARAAGENERPLVAAQWNGFLDQLERIGISPEVTLGWTTWPATAIRLKVTSVFEQTPGSGAGRQIA
jgi:hypothetical protein